MHPKFFRTNDASLPSTLNTGRADVSTSIQQPRINVDAVSVTASETLLLAPTTFQAGPREVVALRGENGSGKTTLLRTLAGRMRPTTGTVQVRGKSVNDRDPEFRHRVAALIGLPPMASDLTVFDHLALVSSTWETSRRSVGAATRRVLTEFGLAGLETRFPHELSSGQTQLFGLALVFVRPFDVLLLDEPEQRLDPTRIELLAQAMLDRRAGGATIVAATHSSRLTELTADRTITLEVHA